MNRFLPRLAIYFFFVFAGRVPVQAQQPQISLAGGGQLSWSNVHGVGEKPLVGGVLTLKAGLVFKSNWGIGLYYELTEIRAAVTRPYPLGTYSYEALVATPQSSYGLELYRKAALGKRGYLRLGALLGYVQGSVTNPTAPGGRAKTGGASFAGGGDAALVFPLLGQLNGVAGAGLRFSHLSDTLHPEQQRINTFGVPFSLGLSYTFK